MAEAVDIEAVKDLMPGDDTAWDDVKITTYLDGGKTVYGVMAQFWESQAAKYSTMLDVNESGSVRSLSRLYDNAIRLAEYWRDRAQKEKDKEEQNENDRIRFNTITRI